MGLQTLYTAATGMDALQTKLDTIANNLAKRSTQLASSKIVVISKTCFIATKFCLETKTALGSTATGIHVGLGIRVESVQADFAQGAFEQTNRPLDWAIVGDGLFQVTDPSGANSLHPGRKFRRGLNGQIVTSSASDGRLLEPAITIPQDTVGIVVKSGRISLCATGGNAAASAGRTNSIGGLSTHKGC